MNGFEKHGIKHSSPSSINMWSSAPCAWVGKYLLGQKFSFGLAARAGVLAEEAVVNVLANGWTQDKATEEALASYNKACAFGASDAERKRGESIAGMIDAAITELKPFGDPDFGNDIINGKKQRKIELLCNGDGWKLPIIGYLDFYYPHHGLVVDLKTTMRLPSAMSDEHMRQGAVYRAAMGNANVKFLYVSRKTFKWHEIENSANILSEVKSILNRQERFLRMGDAQTLQGIVPVNASSFYWGGDEQIRQELYGI